jgi:ribonuclease-3
MDLDLGKLEAILGVKFEDRMLLLSAMTHRSYLNEFSRHPVPHNERLEFAGDAVLELATTEYIYMNYNGPEGNMTNVRSAVVNYKHLGKVAQDLGIEHFLLMSKGETKGNKRARLVILANCFEAIIGAMYFDQGFDVCRDFISKHVLVALPKIVSEQDLLDPKSHLQHRVQAELELTPTYRVLGVNGPDHDKEFLVGVFAGEKELARGLGPSKQEAEVSAARDALDRLYR